MDKKSYTIIVLDYCYGEIRYFHFMEEPANPEEWLTTHDSKYKESECNWMGVYGYIPHEEHHYNCENMEEIHD